MKKDAVKFKIILLVITLLGIFCMTESTQAATYYVSPSGSASWPSCTSSGNPCAVSTAMSNAVAGDTVNFNAGMYLTSDTGSYEYPSYRPSHSGTSGSPITFKATFGTVTIKRASPAVGMSAPLIGEFGQAYIVWDGFVVDLSDWPQGTNTSGARFGEGNHNTIQNCEIIGHFSTVNDNYAAIGGEPEDYLTIRNNKLHGFNDDNYGSGSGIIFFTSTNAIIENNEIYDNNLAFFDKQSGQHTATILSTTMLGKLFGS